MSLKSFEIYDYFLDSKLNITGGQIVPKKKHPELLDNPEPLDEFIKYGPFDEYKRPKWRLINFKFVKNNYKSPTNKEFSKNLLSKMSMLDIAKRLIRGINDNKDKSYLELVELINNSDNLEDNKGKR